jgi:hypothetical protein
MQAVLSVSWGPDFYMLKFTLNILFKKTWSGQEPQWGLDLKRGRLAASFKLQYLKLPMKCLKLS